MKILLGVGGGIAAYKAAELARALMERGHDGAGGDDAPRPGVRPPPDLRRAHRPQGDHGHVLRGQPGRHLSSAVEHIGVAQENDLLVVAPATADLMAKFAHGLADDFLTTLYLAFTGPVVLAPAMNTNMWRHPATQANLETLRRRGHRIVDPEDGLSGLRDGRARAAGGAARRSPRAVEAELRRRRDLEGETVLVTAGPTQEPLDPVRYISNRSSGKMGYALAEAAAARGARVILISGPVHLAPPRGVDWSRCARPARCATTCSRTWSAPAS